MRKCYLFFFTAAISIFNSQTLTQSFNEPVIGDVDKNYKMDTSAYTTGLPNITGANCVWNFANLKGAFPMVIDSFISPAGTPSASGYPTSTYVQHRDALWTYYKSSSSPQQTELLGAYSTSLSLTFTNSAIIAGYPINYGYILTDPVLGNFKLNGSPGTCNGSITISADGTGTVNFPNNVTIPNVLRLKSWETLTLSSGPLPVGTFNQYIYNYYMPGKKYPILSVNYTIYQLIAGTPTITALVYGNSNYFTVEGISENSSLMQDCKIFPNPFRDKLFLETDNLPAENEFTLFNINGEVISSSGNFNEIKTSTLVPGIYFLEIKNKEGVLRKKIIRE